MDILPTRLGRPACAGVGPPTYKGAAQNLAPVRTRGFRVSYTDTEKKRTRSNPSPTGLARALAVFDNCRSRPAESPLARLVILRLEFGSIRLLLKVLVLT